MRDSAILQAPLLDHHGIDLGAAGTSVMSSPRASVTNTTRRWRHCGSGWSSCRPRHGNQYRRTHMLSVTGAAARRRLRRDACGNAVARLRAERVTHAIEFRLAADRRVGVLAAV